MNESIGARLRLARERRRLTLAQVSEATRVRAHYLQALENDDVSGMPSAAQARGFLRLYAEFLGINPDDLVPPVPAAPASSAAPTIPEATAAPKATGPSLTAFLSRLRGRLARQPGGVDELATGIPGSAEQLRSPAPPPGDAAPPVIPTAGLQAPSPDSPTQAKKKARP